MHDEDMDLDLMEDEDQELTLEQVDVAALRNRRAEILKELEDLDEKLAVSMDHRLVTSVVMRPVQVVRDAFEAMHPQGKTRKQIIDFCTSRGVSPNTAKTQYALTKRHWEQYGCVPTPGAKEIPEA